MHRPRAVSILAGRLDYLTKPELRASWGGPLNGQTSKRLIMTAVITTLPARMIVETGTFRGTTTEWLLGFGVPVHSVEKGDRAYGFAKQRLGRRASLTHGDTLDFLRSLRDDPGIPNRDTVFYLDAHSPHRGELPLSGELELILTSWRHSVIVVDDFRVPDDDYGYADYGGDKVLDGRYLDVLPIDVGRRFYPAMHSTADTGVAQGSVVLGTDAQVRDDLAKLDCLRS